jgi:hypothetical protein
VKSALVGVVAFACCAPATTRAPAASSPHASGSLCHADRPPYWNAAGTFDRRFAECCVGPVEVCGCRCSLETLDEAASVLSPEARQTWLLGGACVGAWPWPEGMPVVPLP